ncbi:endonuclease [Candidatus Woesearchaeota archaeon]|nr:MAG: endonuclease [Candidatus Woesearchaeota archaeon]
MNINPYWVSGFVDGEGTFYVGINKNSTMTVGYQILPEFRIVQHERDIKLLHELKKYFNCGVVRVNHDNRYELRIRSIEHINKIVIPHFNKYELLTQKKFDFIKFKKIINLINKNEHLSKNGLLKIIEISSQMNRKDKKKALEIKKDILGQDKVHA